MSTDNPAINPAMLDAYKDVAQVMLGFRSRAEMEDVFSRPLVWAAVKNLAQALDETRQCKQPDEFALALAIEAELLSRFTARGDNLEGMFNDLTHHSLPSEDLYKRITAAWASAALDAE